MRLDGPATETLPGDTVPGFTLAHVAEAAGVATANLAQLGADLADPELRAEVVRMWAAHRDELERLPDAADLPAAPAPADAARILSALVHGAQVHWAVGPEGSLRKRLEQDVDAVLTA